MSAFGGITRRMVLEAIAFGAAMSAARASQPSDVGPATARGRVMTDARNGSRGIPGVLVTNGVDVVQTDVDGFYSLPLPDEAIISVVKPTGFSVETSPETRLPRFHYIHQPKGTPADLVLSGPSIAATSEKVDSIDFVLSPRSEPSAFNVLLLADPQPGDDEEVDFIRDDVIPRLLDIDAAFGVTLGDIVGDNLPLIPRVCRLIGQAGRPWYNVCGNHDLNYESPDNQYARETFKSHFGPSHYALEYASALFIMLDNVIYEGARGNAMGQAGSYHDAIEPAQLRFVSNILDHVPDNRLIVIGMHIPMKTKTDGSGREHAVADCAELLALIGDRPCISFSGHTHMAEHKYIHYVDGSGVQHVHHHQVLSAVCGSWWSGPRDDRGIPGAMGCDGSPRGFYVLSVDGTRYSTRFMPAGANPERKMRILLVQRNDASVQGAHAPLVLGQRLTVGQTRTADVVVNFFDGGPRSRVTAVIDGGPEFAMTRTPMIDPFVEDSFRRDHEKIKPWAIAEISQHVWTTPLPGTLEVGPHRIQIVAVDEFERISRDNLIIEIIDISQTLVGGL